MKTVVIYHDPCNDGFTARWIAEKYLTKVGIPFELIPVNYNQDYSHIPDIIRGQNVLVFDFSFKRELMEQYNSIAQCLEVFDHHKTAAKECEGLPYCTFDMNKSGAMLAWERLHPGMNPPSLVQYVQDYDLWRFALPSSKEINAVLHATEKTMQEWDLLNVRLGDPSSAIEVIRDGRLIKKLELGHIENAIKYATTVDIQGYRVPLINNPNLISLTVERLATDQPFAAAYFMRPDGKFIFSLRSRKPNGIDVSAIAKKFPGGGGHAEAAGFSLDLPEFVELHKTIKEVGK